MLRVNWLADSKHVAIQRLNRAQTTLDLLIADFVTGKARVVLTESDANWINVHDALYFLKDGKRFLWASERSGYRQLYLYDLDGKQLAQLTKGDWEVAAVDGVDEAKGPVCLCAPKKSVLRRTLYRLPRAGSRVSRIT